MTRQMGVILYGPPASGKDTVTSALHRHDKRFEQYQRMKVGPGRITGYRMGTAEDLARLTAGGEVLYTNRRYSAVYAIDRPELDRLLEAGRIPVVHIGQPEAAEALITALPTVRWTTVELWSPREVAAARIEARGTGDTPERLQAWEETPRLTSADLQIDTSRTDPDAASRLIADRVWAWTAVVPVLHLVSDDGTVDLSNTERYAEIASATWVDRFLINGSTTRGDQLSRDERTAVLDIWANAVGPDRVLACSWNQADLTAATERGVVPMAVLRNLDSPDALLQFLQSLPGGATIYSHPSLFGPSISPLAVRQAAQAGCLPTGGKLAKVTLAEISEIHSAAPGFDLWDGSSRRIQQSLDAGADGIVATPLAALLAAEFPSKDVESVQNSVNRTQTELDQLPGRPERRAHLLKQIRANLATSSIAGR
ncbi:hypothetical protein [Nocardia tengchongensis]|uniref:hypothetical protein n=1 Tax=Nocardia tengchongensis TaxID=2055889 RepID=UPI00360DF54D